MVLVVLSTGTEDRDGNHHPRNRAGDGETGTSQLVLAVHQPFCEVGWAGLDDRQGVVMKALKPYVLKKPRKPAQDNVLKDRITTPKQDEGLTGYIGDWEASDIEERFGRALAKAGLSFSFREHFFGPSRTTPGAVEVDFLVQIGGEVYPIFIDGEFAHKTQAQRDNDKIKDARFDDYARRFGAYPSQRIAGDVLETQEQADMLVKEMF